MALPKDVEEQARIADEMLRQMNEPKTEEKTQEAPEEKAPEEDKTQQSAEGKAEEKSEPKPEVKAEEKTQSFDQREYERLKQAHAVLQGKYNAEVPRLYQTIKDLEAKIADAIKPAQAPAESTPKNLDTVISKLKEDYGEDFASNVEALIEARLSKAMQGIKSEVDSVKSSVVKTREEKFLAELAAEVPNWRDIYSDPEFSDFLDREDSFSGATLRDLAVDADKRKDAKRLAKFYKAFLDSKTSGRNEPEVKPVVETKDKREALITPATTGKQNAVVGGEKPDLIKAADLQQFYEDVSRGRYKHRPKEQEAMESRIQRAIANNWVVGG